MKTFQSLKQNPPLFERYFIKEYTIKAIRKFFENRNYHELESQILTNALPQERYLDVLSTDIELSNGEKQTAYLIPSTETWNKKILAAGLGNHFTITKVFRGLEEIGPNHAPEFTMMEWYEVGNNYNDLMDTCEEMINFVINFLDEKKLETYDFSIKKRKFGDLEIDFGGKWQRYSIRELFKKYLNTDLEDIQTLEQIKALAEKLEIKVYEGDDWQAIFELIFANKIELELDNSTPYFLYDYPRIMCPLTKVKNGDELVSEKVELYIAGRELGNGYTELTDWQEQERRFKGEQEARMELGKKSVKHDQDLVDALKLGMPEVAGMGMGLDRLVMILANAKSISEINYFPPSEWDN
jgi:EF-P lysine aminoacylase GenX